MIENRRESAMVAFSKALARAKDEMSMQEKKLCYLYLSKIRFKDHENPREIWIDKKEIAEALGSEASTDNLSWYLRRLSKSMANHSELQFSGKDSSEWEDIPLFTSRKSDRGRLMIKINEDAMPLLEFLKDGNYITLFLKDILHFSSDETGKRAFLLYEKLRLECDTRICNKKVLTVKNLKELWDIPKDGKDSYIRKNGKFERPMFEKRVLLPVLEQLDTCEHVVLQHFNDDALFQKKKQKNRVIGYEIAYRINKYPSNNAKNESGEILKSARPRRNYRKGRSTKQVTVTGYSDYKPGYDYDDLERQLANSPNN